MLKNRRHTRLIFPVLVLIFPLVLLLLVLTGPGLARTIYAAGGEANAAQTTPVVQFTASTYFVDENVSGGLATINVQVSAVPTQTANTITVTYTTADGTATAGVDYGTATGQLVFAPNDSAVKSFTVTIINDSLPESDETINLILQEPKNATLGGRSVAQLVIRNDDASPTPTGAAATPVFSDRYEANNSISTAYTLDVGDLGFCNRDDATLWPAGDVDFYRFWARGGAAYQLKTDKVDIGLDTYMVLYGPQGQRLAENDNFQSGFTASQIIFSASADGYHYIEITNRDASDPANKTYCVSITQIPGTATPTPLPTGTRVGGVDECENNFDRNTACLIAPNEEVFLNFVPAEGKGPDNDFFKMWIRQGWNYECETFNLSGFNDTNMILYDQNGNGIAGNNDKSFADLDSLVPYRAPYTGWLYILVGPVVPVDYAQSFRYTYSLACRADASTPTPAPPTRAPSTGSGTGGGGGFIRPTSTPTFDPNVTPTPDLILTIQALETQQAAQPLATQPARVGIQPLPSATPNIRPPVVANFSVVLFYDSNSNNLPELTEGIQETAVLVYDGATNELLSLGYTNQAGVIRFNVSPTTSLIKLSIPYFGINQTINAGAGEILIRIAPSNLPGRSP